MKTSLNSQNVVFTHQFVEFIPEAIEERTVYVSVRFATVAHLCACGCGNKVVTPLKPTDWSLIFDGKTISLDPSIGNWSFPCGSHYWIRKNQIKWEVRWSRGEIDAVRAQDRLAKERYFGQHGQASPQETDVPEGIWTRLAQRFRLLWTRDVKDD